MTPDVLDVIAKYAGILSPFVMTVIAIVAFYKGWVIPASVVKAIVADTVTSVMAATARDTDKVVAELSVRIIAAFEARFEKHEDTLLREMDNLKGKH